MSQIFVSYGLDLQKMTCELMEKADISKRLKPGARVCIKPNLVVAKTADKGATTHPEIVEGIIQYLKACGISRIAVTEGSWVGGDTEKAWNICGYSQLAHKYNVELVDTKRDSVVTTLSQGIKLSLCESVLEADYLINVPVLKGHCQATMTCCLKNLKGCIPDNEKRRYHTMGLHRPIAALADAIKPNLHIIDGVCGDLCFEEGGNPIDANRIILGFDPVLLDSYGAQLMGYEPDDIAYLRYAKNYGVGEYISEDTEIIELGAQNKPKIQLVQSGTAKRLASFIDEDGACSACYAALIFALNKTGGGSLKEKIHIGQGFKGKKLSGIGVGSCASGCAKSVAGCPPKAVDIIRLLTDK